VSAPLAGKDVDRYKVRGHLEEFQCDNCGEPVYAGDTAVMIDESAAFCSTRCAQRFHEEEE
jgi:hypothetical protein